MDITNSEVEQDKTLIQKLRDIKARCSNSDWIHVSKYMTGFVTNEETGKVILDAKGMPMYLFSDGVTYKREIPKSETIRRPHLTHNNSKRRKKKKMGLI